MSRVNIVATIGPQTDNSAALTALQQAGMDIARLNGSHADLGWHKKALAQIRLTIPNVPVLLDLPGSKIRTLNVAHEYNVADGDQVIFTGDQFDAGQGKVAVDFPLLHQEALPGDVVVMDDGSLSLVVDYVSKQDVICHAAHAGVIRNRQGVHLPRLISRPGLISERAKELIAFAAAESIDFIGISSVETAADILPIRQLAGIPGPQVISKIETQRSLGNLGEIFEASDAIMIDRGDLAVDTQPEIIALLQKRILAEARQAALPVIVATEILNSMIEHPIPTKAEISDITNSIFDGAAALMLSAETAVGKFPVEAVGLMRRVADAVSESWLDSAKPAGKGHVDSVPGAMGEAIEVICRDLEITKIVAITISGYAARMISTRNPGQPILAVTNDPKAARRFNIFKGTKGIYVDIPYSTTSMDHIPRCLEELWLREELVDSDFILVTAVGYPKSGNRMNLIETHKVADLRESLGWIKPSKPETVAE